MRVDYSGRAEVEHAQHFAQPADAHDHRYTHGLGRRDVMTQRHLVGWSVLRVEDDVVEPDEAGARFHEHLGRHADQPPEQAITAADARSEVERVHLRWGQHGVRPFRPPVDGLAHDVPSVDAGARRAVRSVAVARCADMPSDAEITSTASASECVASFAIRW